MTKTSSRKATKAKPQSIRRVLILAKKTRFTEAHELHDKHTLDLIAAKHPSAGRIISAHEEQQHTKGVIDRVLAQRRIEQVTVSRETFGATLRGGKFDMVITLGGDGTILDASHFLKRMPILGVNSAVSSSHGHYCLANADTFEDVLDTIITGTLQPLNLLRLAVTLDGKELPVLALNEVVAADPELGATSHYKLTVGDVTEVHASDGFYIGTAAGSTAWMRSYGAQVLPVLDRRIQVLSRGLIINPDQPKRIERGLVSSRHAIKLVSCMERGIVIIDGKHISYPFPRGAELVVKVSRTSTRLFINSDVNDHYLTVTRPPLFEC